MRGAGLFMTLSIGLLFLVSSAWAGDGDNYFQYGYGPADTDTLADSNTRGVTAGSDLDMDGKPEIIVTDYDNGCTVHVYEVTGDNTLEWVWSSAGSNGTTCREVITGDLDNDTVGEIIFAVDDGTWAADYEGGIHVYEWDGTTDNGYGAAATSIYKPNPTHQGIFRAEGMAIGDVDGDLQNELVVVDNTSPNDQDGLYILSVSGTFESGFYTWNEEGKYLRTEIPGYNGSPINAQIGDMDGDGNYEAIFGVWDYASLYIVEATGPNAYAYQTTIQIDTTSGGDDVSLNNFEVADLNSDGADEVYYSTYKQGEIFAITGGADVSTITFADNVFCIVPAGEAGGYGLAIGDQDHGTGTDGPDIYTTAYTSGKVYDHEFTGLDPLDPAAWTKYTLWPTDYNGSFGVVAPMVDLDDDGKLEVVVCWTGDEVALPDGKYFRVLEWTGETGVEEYTIAVDVPREFQLAQNYPNPFNAQTTIEYTVSRPGHVSLKVFNSAGQLVKTLVDDYRPINRYAVTWDGTDEGGQPVASGVYFCQMRAGDFVDSKKMSLLK